MAKKLKTSPRPKPRPSTLALKTSPRPKPRPSTLAPKTSPMPGRLIGRDQSPRGFFQVSQTQREGEDMKDFGKVDKKAAGGKLKMVEKGGKKVPAFAADGIGKMAVGGLVGALMNKDNPGGMLGGIIPGVAGMLVRDRAKKDKEAAAKKAKAAKMAKGGMCRGMGAASKGGNYKG